MIIVRRNKYETYERHLFNGCVRKPDGISDQFLTNLRQLSIDCNSFIREGLVNPYVITSLGLSNP